MHHCVKNQAYDIPSKKKGLLAEIYMKQAVFGFLKQQQDLKMSPSVHFSELVVLQKWSFFIYMLY